MDDRPAAPPHPLSSELLGFPADARVLLVNCDDLGMSQPVNSAVLASIERGIATSASLMPPCPAAPHAMELLRRRPEIPCGVHLTLVCDTVRDRWGPLTDRARVRSLLDENGELFPPTHVDRLLAQARLEEVEREFRAQINTVLQSGLAPTHLDWHCLADGGRPDVFELTLALAAEYGLAARVWLAPGRRRVRPAGAPVADQLPVSDHPFLDSFSLPLDGRSAQYAALLRGLPPGLTEWAVHPGLDSAEARAVDPGGWRVRAGDHAFLTSPEARELVRREGVEVIDYRAVQRAWKRARG